MANQSFRRYRLPILNSDSLLVLNTQGYTTYVLTLTLSGTVSVQQVLTKQERDVIVPLLEARPLRRQRVDEDVLDACRARLKPFHLGIRRKEETDYELFRISRQPGRHRIER